MIHYIKSTFKWTILAHLNWSIFFNLKIHSGIFFMFSPIASKRLPVLIMQMHIMSTHLHTNNLNVGNELQSPPHFNTYTVDMFYVLMLARICSCQSNVSAIPQVKPSRGAPSAKWDAERHHLTLFSLYLCVSWRGSQMWLMFVKAACKKLAHTKTWKWCTTQKKSLPDLLRVFFCHLHQFETHTQIH